jgi:hypothetical protein
MSGIKSDSKKAPVDLSKHPTVERILAPVEKELGEKLRLQEDFQRALGFPSKEVAAFIEPLERKREAFMRILDRSDTARVMQILDRMAEPPDLNTHMLIEADPGKRAQLRQERTLADPSVAVAAEFPGLYRRALEGVLETEPEKLVVPQVSAADVPLEISRKDAELDKLEKSLAANFYKNSDGKDVEITPEVRENLRRFVASALEEVQHQGAAEIRAGVVESPFVNTRAILSFGGTPQEYDRALTFACALSVVNKAEEYKRRHYKIQSSLYEACNDGTLWGEGAMKRWPTLSSLVALQTKVEKRSLEEALREPTAEQVRTVTETVLNAAKAEPSFAKFLAKLTELYLVRAEANPAFASVDLRKADKPTENGVAQTVKRKAQRFGLTWHRDQNNMQPEYITNLGKKVLDAFDASTRCANSAQPVPLSYPTSTASVVRFAPIAGVEAAAVVFTPSSEQHRKPTAIVASMGYTGRNAREAIVALEGKLTASEVANRLEVVAQALRDLSKRPPLNELLGLLASEDFWSTYSSKLERYTASSSDKQHREGAPRNNDRYDDLTSSIENVITGFKSEAEEPRLTNPRAIAEVIVEGFIFKGRPLVARNKRPESEVLHSFRRSHLNPEQRTMYENAYSDLKRCGCVDVERNTITGKGANRISLAKGSLLVARILPLMINALKNGPS